jgi:hypothetical protein
MTQAVLDLDFTDVQDPEVLAASERLLSDHSDDGTVKEILAKRWTSCRLLPIQRSFLDSKRRFVVVAAGRRSFKTEGAKRRLVRRAIQEYRFDDGRFIAAAPTHGQARRIYWKDLKRLVPVKFIAGGIGGIRESSMTIPLVNGCEITVMGMDVPERAEGSPIIHFLGDEYANMKERVWDEHISPALAETQGTADFIGVPEGRNHFYERFRSAESDDTGEWDAFHWTAEAGLPLYLGIKADRKRLRDNPETAHLADLPEIDLGIELARREIASAKARMDPLSYDQEFNASFVLFAGRAYYQFDSEVQATEKLEYRRGLPLIICFDFNVDAGATVICQEFPAEDGRPAHTAVIGETHIPKNSNTPLICRTLLENWKHHSGQVIVYGDATGGARSTTNEDSSSNWDIVRKMFRGQWGGVTFKVPKANPAQRSRLNAVNSRLLSEDGTIACRVCPVHAPQTVRCLEGTQLIEGGSGEIDKKSDPKITHWSDALGYYIVKRWPLRGGGFVGVEQY